VAGPHLIQIGEVCTRLRILDISYTNWRAIPVRAHSPFSRYHTHSPTQRRTLTASYLSDVRPVWCVVCVCGYCAGCQFDACGTELPAAGDPQRGVVQEADGHGHHHHRFQLPWLAVQLARLYLLFPSRLTNCHR
jgi:hypothetical protein